MKSRLKEYLDSREGYHRRLAQHRGRIARRISNLLQQKGWKQMTLAEQACLHDAQVSRILSGATNMTLETIARLEIALDAEIITVAEGFDDSSVPVGRGYQPLNSSQRMPGTPPSGGTCVRRPSRNTNGGLNSATPDDNP